MIHDGYNSKYEKSVTTDKYHKSVCIYEVSNGYVVKVEKVPMSEGGYGMDYEKKECNYYISEEDPSQYMEKEAEYTNKEKEGGASSAAEAVRNAF